MFFIIFLIIIKNKKNDNNRVGLLYKNSNSNYALCYTKSFTPYKKGAKYICNNLGDNERHIFYVINDSYNNKKVDLIMDRDYSVSTYIYNTKYDNNNNASLGPINAMKYLPTIDVWKNLESPKDDSGYDYSGYAARLPNVKEIVKACNIKNFDQHETKNIELKNINECSFLWENTQYNNSKYKYNGYYTSTPIGSWYHVWSLYSTNISKEDYYKYNYISLEVPEYNTVLLKAVSASYELGIRPVISLSK